MHQTAADFEAACNARAANDGHAAGFSGNTMMFAGAKYFVDHQNNYVVPDADVGTNRVALGGKVFIFPAKTRLTNADQLSNEHTRDKHH